LELLQGDLSALAHLRLRTPVTTDQRRRTYLGGWGFAGDMAMRPTASLSGGEKARLVLALIAWQQPALLLLDEPTNHLDIESIRWLEEFLLRQAGTLLFVTHDRVFLERLATRIVELDRGRMFDWSCDYPTFLKRKEEVLAAEEQAAALFDKRLAQEEVWIRKGVEARRTRNEGRVRALKAMRETRRQRRERQGTAQMQIQEADRSGALVIEAKGVSFGYGETPVLKGLTTTIMRGDKVGIIGPNGSGKTTLLKLLLGEVPPSQGSIRLGTNLETAYFDQTKATLEEDRTVQQNISGYETILVNGQSRHVLGYLQDFLFPPERSRTLVKYLSGGERSRLLLARLFTRPSNLLVLDEPTNDLDVETLELLESLLVEYQGTVLLVSHDRAFLNEVVTSTLAIDEGGTIREYDGGYDDYLRQRQEQAAGAAAGSQAATPAVRPRPEAPRKLSYKDQRELEGLPVRIEEREAALGAIHEAMADPAFYRKPSAEIAEARSRMAGLEGELAALYDRWQALDGAGR
jgi:ATP-binding cassette subfamily F protein uup